MTTVDLYTNRTTRVTTIDIDSGQKIGESDDIAGSATGPIVLSEDRLHAYQAVAVGPGGGPYESSVAIINLTNGDVEGTLVSAPGLVSQFIIDDQNDIAYFRTTDYSTKKTIVKTVDMRTGDEIDSAQVDGTPYGQLTTSPDGNRMYQATVLQTVNQIDNGDGTFTETTTETTTYAFFDTHTGMSTGQPIVVPGYKYEEKVVGDRLFVSTYEYASNSSHLTVIDANNGVMLGSTAADGGQPTEIIVKDGRAYLVTRGAQSAGLAVIDSQGCRAQRTARLSSRVDRTHR